MPLVPENFLMTIKSVDPATVEVALACKVDLPAVAVLGTDEGRVVGSGGLAWGGGRATAFLPPWRLPPLFRRLRPCGR